MTIEQNIWYTLVDDHAIFRSGLQAEIRANTEYKFLNEFSNIPDLKDHQFTTCPTFLLLDLELPGINGVEAFQTLRRKLPYTKIIAVTQTENIQKVLKDKGFNGYIKKSDTSNLNLAIAQVLDGEDYFPETENNVIFGKHGSFKIADLLRKSKVSNREMEVVMLAYGKEEMSSAQISKALFISKKTVDTHRKNFIRHTGIRGHNNSAKFVEAIVNEDIMLAKQILETAKYNNN